MHTMKKIIIINFFFLFKNNLYLIVAISIFLIIINMIIGYFFEKDWISYLLPFFLLLNFLNIFFEFFSRYFLLINKGFISVLIEIVRFVLSLGLLFTIVYFLNIEIGLSDIFLIISLSTCIPILICYLNLRGYKISGGSSKKFNYENNEFLKWGALEQSSAFVFQYVLSSSIIIFLGEVF